MGWEKRGGRTYYYRAERHGGRVVKTYVGSGNAGARAAAADAERRANQLAAHREAESALAAAEATAALARRYERECYLLMEAALLAAGLRRQGRHRWRVWRDGRHQLTAAG